MFLNIKMRHAKLEVQKWRKVNLGVELRYVIDLIEFDFNSEFRLYHTTKIDLDVIIIPTFMGF